MKEMLPLPLVQPSDTVRRGLFLVLALAVVCVILAFAFSGAVSDALYAMTGEEDTIEGLKGVGALAILWLTQRPPQTAPFTPMPHVDVNPYGVNTFLQLEAEEENVRRQLELLQDAGFGWMRQEFPWEDIEIHAKGDFEDRRTEPTKSAWLKYDRIVELAEEHDVRILARLDNPPAWSRAQGDAVGTLAPPDDFSDFGDFVAAVAERYCGRIGYYQIWNEPNIYPEWGEQDVDPEGYTDLLRVAYQRIKTVCPQATVVSAALAQNVEAGGSNMSDLRFLERMYAAGAGDYFDVLGAQAFGLWTGPTDRRVSRDRANFNRIELTRDVMVRHADAGKPIWVTEMGWAAVPDDIPTVFGRVTREQQARYLADAYQRANEEWPFVGPLFAWFLRRPDWSEQNQDWFYFGLVSPDWETTPAFDAVVSLASRPPAVPPGLHQEEHPALRYDGKWPSQADGAASLGSYRLGTVGDTVGFSFSGSDLTLITAPGGGAGTASVVVDGEEVAPVLLPAGARVQVVRDLPVGRHTVGLTVRDGTVALDAVLVRRSHDHLVRQVLLAIAAIFAVASGVALFAALQRTKKGTDLSV